MLISVIFRRHLSHSRKFQGSYHILKVKSDASAFEIRQSYLRLSKIYHPDNTTSGDHNKFIRIRDAFEKIKHAPLKDGQINPLDSYYNSLNEDYKSDKDWEQCDKSLSNFDLYRKSPYSNFSPLGNRFKPFVMKLLNIKEAKSSWSGKEDI